MDVIRTEPARPGDSPDSGEVSGRRVGRRAFFAGGAGVALAATVPAAAHAGARREQSTTTTAVTTVRQGPLSLTDPQVGCLLDGSDERAKVQTALGLLGTAGGEIYQPVGTLGLGAEVTLPANVSWTGENRGGSVIQPASGYTGRLMSSGVYSYVANLTFYGARTSGVLLTIRAPRSVFTNLHFSNSGSHALEVVGTSGMTAHGNQFSDICIEDCVGIGILTTAWAYDNEFTNVWIGECQTGMRLNDSSCIFNTLHVWGCVGNGVELRNNAHQNLFQNVYLETNGTSGTGNGVDAWKVTGNQFVGGKLWKNASHGMSLVEAPRTRVMGLDIYENDRYGIWGGDSPYCQVIGNQFYDLSTPVRQDRPIYTGGTSNYWIISNNMMRTADHVVGGKVLAGANNAVSGNIE